MGRPHRLDELPDRLDLTKTGELLVVVDRLEAMPAAAGRISEAIATAFQEGEGIAIAVRDGGRASIHSLSGVQCLRYSGRHGHSRSLLVQ